jgi:hypothetical protein
MLHLAKFLIYGIIIAAVIFLYWFLPKYSFVQKNPGYCAPLTDHLYYCGSGADLQGLFK